MMATFSVYREAIDSDLNPLLFVQFSFGLYSCD